ncbi:FliO/MopB family protein [Breznakiellaceae bacterium SP9]
MCVFCAGFQLIYAQDTAQTPIPTEAIDEHRFPIGPTNQTGPIQSQGTSDFWAVLRMVLVLALAATAIYGIIYFIKRANRPQEQTDPFVRVISRVSIGANRYVLVVLVGTKAFLVGSGEGGVSLITEIQDQETLDAMIVEDSRIRGSSKQGKLPDFAGLLQIFGGGKVPPSPESITPDSLRRKRERLQGMHADEDTGKP